jgi:hypothetical protein
MTYNAFLGWMTLFKFMAILHYAYLVLKMPGPRGVISIRGDVKQDFDCHKESWETADKLMASTKLQELKQALAESPWIWSCPRPRPPRGPSNWRTQSVRQFRYPQRNLSRLLT